MATSGRSEAGDTTAHGSDEGFVRALGLFPATTVNMSQMVGIGPFITIPLMISAMGGPQALIGWVLGAVLAMADGLVWAELVAVGLTVLTVALLYRRIESIAAVVRFLWFGMIITVSLVIVATVTHFDPSLAFDFPKHAVSFSVGFFSGLGAGLLIAIYDYLGYFTAAYLGDDVEDPGRVI